MEPKIQLKKISDLQQPDDYLLGELSKIKELEKTLGLKRASYNAYLSLRTSIAEVADEYLRVGMQELNTILTRKLLVSGCELELDILRKEISDISSDISCLLRK